MRLKDNPKEQPLLDIYEVRKALVWLPYFISIVKSERVNNWRLTTTTALGSHFQFSISYSKGHDLCTKPQKSSLPLRCSFLSVTCVFYRWSWWHYEKEMYGNPNRIGCLWMPLSLMISESHLYKNNCQNITMIRWIGI